MRSKLWLLCAILLGAPLAAIGGCYKYQFPNGRDHCCDKQLNMALRNYAETHGGNYPTGGATPEASLSLLYPTYAEAYLLRGKNHSEEAAEQLLAAGKPLTPQTCGWFYVDGLTLNVPGTNESRIVIFWDKVGSGHNAERLPPGSHTVDFMDGSSRVISAADWPRFIADQAIAVAAIRRGVTPIKPWVPD